MLADYFTVGTMVFRKENMNFKERDRFNIGCLGSFFIFGASAAITDSLILATILTVVFLLVLPALHDYFFRKLNEFPES